MKDSTEQTETSLLVEKVASQEEVDKIHQFNHETFADEIPQHQKREDGKLIDAFHEKKYLYSCAFIFCLFKFIAISLFK